MRLVPVVLLVGCAGSASADPCLGDGPAALELGTGELDAFVPYADGDVATLRRDTSGEFGFEVALRTEGLDTSEDVTFTASIVAADELPALGLFAEAPLLCLPDDHGWMRVWLWLASRYQREEDATALDGEPLSLDVTVEDAALDEVTRALELVIEASGTW